MLDAIRNLGHRTRAIADLLKRGINPYRPLGLKTDLGPVPVLIPGAIANAEPIATFLGIADQEQEALRLHGEALNTEIDWAMHHLMDASRPDSLLSSKAHQVTAKALIFHDLGLAISPPDDWHSIPLKDAVIAFEGGHDLFDSVPDRLPDRAVGDPIGLVRTAGQFSMTIELPAGTFVSLLFLPMMPVIAADLIIGDLTIPAMKTARGLFFWIQQEVTNGLQLRCQGAGSILLGMPLLAAGTWTNHGFLTLNAGNHPAAVFVEGVEAGANLALSIGNIQNWLEIAPGKSAALPFTISRLTATPNNGQITLPANKIPSRVYLGNRSWSLEDQALSGGIWVTSNVSYFPLEATAQLIVPAGRRFRLRSYIESADALSIPATLPGQIFVNGTLQQAGQLALPAGEAEILIELMAGTYSFYPPLPPAMPIRARYSPAQWHLSAGVLTIINPELVPYEILLRDEDLQAVTMRVLLPVQDGRPAVVADLRLR